MFNTEISKMENIENFILKNRRIKNVWRLLKYLPKN